MLQARRIDSLAAREMKHGSKRIKTACCRVAKFGFMGPDGSDA